MWVYHVSGLKEGEHYFIAAFKLPYSPTDEAGRRAVEGAILDSHKVLTSYELLFVVAVNVDEVSLQNSLPATWSYDLRPILLPRYTWVSSRLARLT